MATRYTAANLGSILKCTASNFIENNSLRLAGALAYNAIFSLPPLLLIVITAASTFLDQEAVTGKLFTQIDGLVGAKAAATIQDSIRTFNQQQQGGISAIIGVGTLIFAATTFFVTLQESINSIWNVKAKPDTTTGSAWNFVRDRLLSFGLILSVALLLLMSFVISALLTAFTDYLSRLLPGITLVLIKVIDFVVSLGVTSLLFAMIYRYLPDAIIRWRDVRIGALITGTLFLLGKYLISFYISNFDPGSAYGAAGSIIVLLVWIYYSSLIIFFGAEFTQEYAAAYGQRVQPKAHAVRIETREVPFHKTEDSVDSGRPEPEGVWRDTKRK
ncbi:YihY/virulence factor BrkB family protein [Hymenobacter profundi]|uniref:YihY/virulence factor BrkB family protein n=1 Tax=Hymenobacter profundi TaxID=1982110 RepID=A0ABS6X871_9BACT|nr:YihY/virulence factor BrkB family protein [Hymenobacter profundi]MBW3131129.1 YihY/virulence factor BrkB family protein [Hymenobacter profundi]